MQLHLAFLYFLIATSAVRCSKFEEVATAFDCGKLGTDILCLEQKIILYCNTTNPSLKWKIPCNYSDSKNELDFNSLDNIGKNKTCYSFRANLADKSGQALFSSLTFTVQLEYNNTNITCLDGFSGENYTCFITMAGRASEPLNVNAEKKSEIMNLMWEPPIFSGGVPIDRYDVTVSPSPHDGTCSSGNCSVPGTDVTIDGLGCSSYNFTVQARNCIGQGTFFKNSTYSGLPSKVLNLNRTENGAIRWDEPYNGGENISHYTVSHVFGSESWNTTQTLFYHGFLALSDGEYNISVQAVNCHGKGEPIFISITVHNLSVALYAILSVVIVIIIIIAAILIIFAAYAFKKCGQRRYAPVNGAVAM